MENAADALIMASAVFVLILILSITAFAFSNARLSLDNIFTLSDKEFTTVQGDEEYYYLSTSGLNENLTRTVGIETIIPSIYRAFAENYKIEFDFGTDDGYYLYEDTKNKDEYGNNTQIKSIDLAQLTLSDSQKKDFIKAILYHKYKEDSVDNQVEQINQFNNDFLGNRNKNKQ